jgi:hypothetical protein
MNDEMALIRHIHRFPGVDWDWQVLSLHPSVNLKVLKTFPNRSWSWALLTKNPNFVWLWVQEFPNKPWNWRHLSESTSFNWSWVREFPNKSWNWNILSDKIDGISTVKEFPDKPWNWYALTIGPKTEISDILGNSNLPWKINELLFTKIDEEIISFIRFYRSHYDVDAWCDHTARASWKLIKANLDLPWVLSFAKVSADDFSEEDVRYLYEPSFTWNWNHLSETLDFNKVIIKCIDLPWEHNALSRNKTVTHKDVMKFPEIRWNYNVMCLDGDVKEWNASNTIKKFWKRCVTDPAYTMCRKILFEDLNSIQGMLPGRASSQDI